MSEIAVLTWGVFDLLTPGHMRLLRKARFYGTRLIVGINSDVSVRKIRASSYRPVMNELERSYMLRHIVGVDEVIIFDKYHADDLIREVHPRFAIKGSRIPKPERWALEDVFAQFILLDPLPSHPHTTELIARAHQIYMDEQEQTCLLRK